MWRCPRAEVGVIAAIVAGLAVCGENVSPISTACPCGRSFRPVCGTDGRTYDNRCMLDCDRINQNEGLRLDYNGTCCPPATLCADYYDPVCDNLGRTHDNECHFDHMKCLASKRHTGNSDGALQIARRGRCEPLAESGTTKNLLTMSTTPATTRASTIESTAVESTKSNDNHNNNDSSKNGDAKNDKSEERDSGKKQIFRINLTENERRRAVSPALSRRVDGTPAEGTRCNFFCDEALEPLCDSNGHTHRNLCKFELAICRLASRGLPTPSVIISAACGEEENDRPDSRQYYVQRKHKTSEASLKAEKSMTTTAVTENSIESSTEPETTADNTFYTTTKVKAPVVANDECSPSNCETYSLDPLCDNYGTTHRSECHFRVAVCRRMRNTGIGNSTEIPQMKIVHYGRCQDVATVRNSTTEIPQFFTIDNVNKTTTAIADIPKDRCEGLCDESDELLAVCDNANQTHVSVCALTKWNCQQLVNKVENKSHESGSGTEERILVHVGACHSASPVFTLKAEICPYKCGKQYRPVCDTHNVTHRNLCTFQLLNCYARKMGVRERGWLSSLSECDSNVSKNDSNTTTDQFVDDGDSLMPALTTILAIGEKRVELATLNVTLETIDELNSRFDKCPEVQRYCDDVPSTVEQRRRPTKWRRRKRVICDSTHTLHRNECEFARARCLAAQRGETLRIIADSECASESSALNIDAESSDSDSNKNTMSARQQRCTEVLAINCSAIAAFDPYCGSDFVTYTNLCILQKARCRDGELEVLFKGECELCLHSPCPMLDANDSTIDDALFVCDQDGKTKSRCEFEMLRCIFDAKFGYNVTAAYDGRCCANADECLAQLFYDDPSGGANGAVCDSLGRRHSNSCLFDVALCRARKIAKLDVEKRACEDTTATTSSSLTVSFAKPATSHDFEATVFPIFGHALSIAHQLAKTDSTTTQRTDA